MTSYKKHVDELYRTVQEGQGRNLDRLEALLELVQSVRGNQPTRPPFRAPPTAGKGEGMPLRIDELLQAAAAQPPPGAPTIYPPSMPAGMHQMVPQGPPQTIDQNVVMHMAEALRMLTQRR